MIRKQKSETAAVARAMLLLRIMYQGCEIWRQNSGSKGRVKFYDYGGKSLPDIVGFDRVTGKIILCEVKTEDGQLSQKQLDCLLVAESKNAIALVSIDGNVFYAPSKMPLKHLPRRTK